MPHRLPEPFEENIFPEDLPPELAEPTAFSDPTGIIGRVGRVNQEIRAEAARLFGTSPTPNQINLAASNLGLAGPGAELQIFGPSRLPRAGEALSPEQLFQITSQQGSPAATAASLGVEDLIVQEQQAQLYNLTNTDSDFWTDDQWNLFMSIYGISPDETIEHRVVR